MFVNVMKIGETVLDIQKSKILRETKFKKNISHKQEHWTCYCEQGKHILLDY